MTVSANRIALGTAQIGLSYGVANRQGKVDSVAAAAIVRRAVDCGVTTLDTAIAYGDAEATLGGIGVGGLDIVTKIPPLPSDVIDISRHVVGLVDASRLRLRVDRLFGVLMHRANDLLESRGDRAWTALMDLKARGLVDKIGISVYSPEEIAAVVHRWPVDLVQAPLNVLDRRLESSGWIEGLAARGMELHVRSAFLQGLLLMDADSRPAKFARWGQTWSAWHRWLADSGLTAMAACLGHALSFPQIRRVVVGVDSVHQLEEILGASKTSMQRAPGELAVDDLQLIDPTNWPRL